MDKNDGHELNVIWISSILKANICPKSSLIPPSSCCLHCTFYLNIGYWRTKASDPQNGSGRLFNKRSGNFRSTHETDNQIDFYFILLTIKPHSSFYQCVLGQYYCGKSCLHHGYENTHEATAHDIMDWRLLSDFTEHKPVCTEAKG